LGPRGAKAETRRDGGHLILSAFADAVANLLASPQDRQRLGMAGRLLLERQYTWDATWRGIEF